MQRPDEPDWILQNTESCLRRNRRLCIQRKKAGRIMSICVRREKASWGYWWAVPGHESMVPCRVNGDRLQDGFYVQGRTPTHAATKVSKNDSVLRNEILLIPKTIGNRKRDCAWGGSGWQTLPEKIYRSQSTNQSAELNEPLPDLCFAICRFSQVRFITPSHLTHNLFFYFQ